MNIILFFLGLCFLFILFLHLLQNSILICSVHELYLGSVHRPYQFDFTLLTLILSFILHQYTQQSIIICQLPLSPYKCFVNLLQDFLNLVQVQLELIIFYLPFLQIFEVSVVNQASRNWIVDLIIFYLLCFGSLQLMLKFIFI